MKARVATLFPAKCEKCGKGGKLEYAHMEPTAVNGRGRGLLRRLRDVMKNQGKYARLCKACHWTHDLLNG